MAWLECTVPSSSRLRWLRVTRPTQVMRPRSIHGWPHKTLRHLWSRLCVAPSATPEATPSILGEGWPTKELCPPPGGAAAFALAARSSLNQTNTAAACVNSVSCAPVALPAPTTLLEQLPLGFPARAQSAGVVVSLSQLFYQALGQFIQQALGQFIQ